MAALFTRRPRVELSEADSEVEASPPNLMMLHCLFAMVFAAATLGLLNCLGFVVRTGSCCPTGNGYTSCEIWQDFRSMLSFFLGALLCCLLTRNDKGATGTGEAQQGACKAQLYTCLL
eukprot:gb/GFBE01015030.1/.p1 GENE.gb/GFBE01015030.1/~~gb/GFBE01015030.1/.p1  ORF type:complete len:118 (+),score=21.58 gb/GFBE01015030.1/:1-354(+)